jgi:hypothetical protein
MYVYNRCMHVLIGRQEQKHRQEEDFIISHKVGQIHIVHSKIYSQFCSFEIEIAIDVNKNCTLFLPIQNRTGIMFLRNIRRNTK